MPQPLPLRVLGLQASATTAQPQLKFNVAIIFALEFLPMRYATHFCFSVAVCLNLNLKIKEDNMVVREIIERKFWPDNFNLLLSEEKANAISKYISL